MNIRVFRVSAHTAGPFGKSVYDSLTDEDRAAVDKVAEEIRKVFCDTTSDETETENDK
jgi:TRAP-type C4-dicarboxylate transport system substrate-binding protein